MSTRSPRTSFGLWLAVAGPALALGGAWPWVIPAFAVVVAGLLHRLRRRAQPLRVPVALGLGLLATGATLVQVLPLPGVRATVAPSLHAWVELSLVGVDEPAWPGLSPTPADTALEAVRLLALCGLALVCAQRSWRRTASAIALAGVMVAIVGLVQQGFGVERIYGLYQPRHLPPGRGTAALLGTFVNPNHQSGLLLLGVFATAGLWVAQRLDDRRLEPRVLLGMALVVQVTALVLSLSRAALLAGAVTGGLALLVAWAPGRTARPSRDPWASRLLGVAGLVGVVAGVGMLGAWHELQSLADPLDHATAMRLRVIASAPELLRLAPLTGIGRGAFGDAFPAFDPEPTHVWHSHLECAPLAMLVEWGPLVGGALVVGLPAWWLGSVRHAGAHGDARARRVALLGLLALALQSLADFSLEHLGVAAPAVALAGALSPVAQRARAPRGLRAAAVLLVGLAGAAVPLLTSTAAWRSAAAERAEPDDAELARRPLHAPLHRARARAAAAAEDWAAAEPRARAAVRLQPASPDGWLLLAAAAGARGDEAAERRALAAALARLHTTPSHALVEHLVERFPEPAALAELAPCSPPAWLHLADALLAHAPRHADAVAAVRSQRAPDDPEPLRYRAEAALALERPALALHHARLWRAVDARDARAHLAVARALQAHAVPSPVALRDALERALVEADLADPRLRGMIEEQLLRALLRAGDPADHERVHELAVALRSRPADDASRQRRLALVQGLLPR